MCQSQEVHLYVIDNSHVSPCVFSKLSTHINKCKNKYFFGGEG